MPQTLAIVDKTQAAGPQKARNEREPTVARTIEQRIMDSTAKLAAGGDAWLATSGPAGPHLVPLSLAWDSDPGELLFCTEQQSVTARNIASEPAVRVGLGPTRDVLMIDGTARTTGAVQDDASSASLFHDKTGWDPRHDSGDLIFIRVAPSRMQAWRDVDEIEGRTIMVDGAWKTTT